MSLDPGAPQKRPPGRPRKVYHITGRKAANLAMLNSSSRPPDSVPSLSGPNADDPHSHPFPPSLSTSTAPVLSPNEILATKIEADRRSRHPQWTQSATLENNPHLFLASIPRPSPPWTQVAVVRTLDLIYWFDSQMNDYTRGYPNTSQLIRIQWFGHPGDSPVAANTRRFLVHWIEPSILTPEALQQAIIAQRVVHRWNYRCVGACAQVSHDDLMTEPWPGFATDHDGSNWDGFEGGNSTKAAHGHKDQPAISRDHRCPGDVELVLEIKAHDLGVVYIYQRGSHPDASPENLWWSRAMRNEVVAAMRTFGAQPKRIYQEIVMGYRYPEPSAGTSALVFQPPETYPSHRRPALKQVYNLLPAMKRRGRLDADPFRAISILADLNPEKIYNYSPHDYKKADKHSEFTCALTTPYALETLILHGTKDGLGMDSSWRNKNENRAAVTILIAVDANGHLSPGSVLISANIQVPTLLLYLQETEKKVIERAKSIAADKNCILHHLRSERETLYNISKDIAASGTWKTHKWMIDKSSTLLQAILQYCPSSRVHVCQFHIVQSIQRLDGENGRVKSAPRMPYTLTYNVVKAFRNLQRCRTMEEFPEYRKQFERELWAACHDEQMNEDEDDVDESDTDEDVEPSLVKKRSKRRLSRTPVQVQTERYRFLLEYFDKYWFSDYWLEYVTDISLPPGETRDGTNNTNNWAESTFLVFDKVFLDMRKNKRIDRLGAIILNEWFPYYEECQKGPARMPSHIYDDIMRAYALWDADWINPIGNRTYRVIFVNNDGTAEAVNVDLKIPRCTPCSQFSQTGKYCIHMRAAILYEKNGPVGQWQEKETLSLRKATEPTGSAAIPRAHSDYPFHNQLSRMVPELLQDATYANGRKQAPPATNPPPPSTSNLPASSTLERAEITASNLNTESSFRTAWTNYTGRPGRILPLHPRRTRRHVTFQKKRGPTRALRGKNSLFLRSVIQDAKKSGKQRPLKRQRTSQETSTTRNNVSSQNPPHSSGNVEPSLSSEEDGLTAEEIGLYSSDVRRWDNPQYTLRIEEMQVLVVMMDSICDLNDLHTWVGISGWGNLETEVTRVLQRSKDGLEEGSFTYRIHRRFSHVFRRLIFLHLEGFHWTIWDYAHVNDTVHCVAINPIANRNQLESIKPESHWAVIDAMRKVHNLPPIRLRSHHPYNPILTGLQSDSTSCGFWVIFLVLASIIGIPASSPSFSTLTIDRVKGYLRPIWLGFLQEPGLDARHLIPVYSDLAPVNCSPRLALKKGHMIARREYNMRMIIPEPTDQTVLSSPIPIHDFDPLRPSMMPHVIAVCERLLADENLDLVIGPYFFGPQQIHSILNRDHDRYGTSGLIPDTVVNAYLFLLGAEYEKQRQYHPEIPDFAIADNIVTTVMANRPTSGTFKPNHQLEKRTLWFPKINIFEKDLILLPWHMHAESHWILIAIWPVRRTLRIYDSAATVLTRKHKDILKRVLRFLDYEHSQRNPRIPFPESWAQNQQTYINQSRIANVQQTDAINCGPHMLHFCRSLCQGREEDFATAPAVDITNLRYEMALIFSKYSRPTKSQSGTRIPTSPKTPIESLNPTPAPQTRPSSPPTPTPPTSPRLNLAEFPMDASLISYTKQIRQQKPLPPLLELTERSVDLAFDGIEVGMWSMYRHPHNGLYYPGRIRAVDHEQRKFEWEILSEMVYSPQKAISGFVGVEQVDDYVRNTGLHMSQIGIIRWPGVMDDSLLETAMSAYTHHDARSNRLDLRNHIGPRKQEILTFLREQFSVTQHILSGRTTVLQELREDWQKFALQWPASKRNLIAFEFSELHLQLLDNHDRFIIRHITVWELFSSGETSDQMDKILGLAQSILGYLCLAYYLQLTPDVAYRLSKAQRIIRTECPFEKAWNVMESSVNYNSVEDWGVFREKHRWIDNSTLPLSKLQILDTTAVNSDANANSKSSEPSCQPSQPSQPSHTNRTTQPSQTARASSLTPKATTKSHNDDLEERQHQDTQDVLQGDEIPLAQRRTKRKAAINHAYIKN